MRRPLTTLLLLAAASAPVLGQAPIEDYRRAMGLRDAVDGPAIHTTDAPRWIAQTNRFYYRRAVKGGHEWILVDAATRAKQPAFDHARLSAAVATFNFVDDGRAIEFTLAIARVGIYGTASGGRNSLGDYYSESSNVDDAWRLQRKVLLIVIPGAGHTAGGAYGEHKRFDFFARHLLNVTPPAWTALEFSEKPRTTRTTR